MTKQMMWLFLSNLLAISLIIFVSVLTSEILLKWNWIWNIIVIAFTALVVLFMFAHDVNNFGKMCENISTQRYVGSYLCLYLVSVFLIYCWRKSHNYDRISYMDNQERQTYVYKTHEALTKEVAAFRTLITTLATGSFVALRTLDATKVFNQDFSKVWLFCFISVVFVLLSHSASLISLKITLDRLSNCDIPNDKLREFDNFLEYAFLFVAVVMLIVGYSMLSLCYAK